MAIVLNATTATNQWDKTKVSPWQLGKPLPKEDRGATLPGSFVREFNRIAEKENINMRAFNFGTGRKEFLLSELEDGNPVSIIRAWSGGGAHWQTVIGYDESSDTIYYMDSNDDYKTLNPSDRVLSENWDDFNEDWSRFFWGLKNEMIIYRQIP